MRPICLTLALLFLSSCAGIQKRFETFADQAAACAHMEDAQPLDRLREPCKYADAMAACFGIRPGLRQDIVDECIERRDELREKVLPAHIEADDS